MTDTLSQSARTATRCDELEWALRVELAATYRIVAMLGWGEMIFNHLSLRVPGEEPTYLMNPFGLMYEEVTASNLIKVDLDGNLVEPSDYRPNPAGFLFHGAIHRTVADAHCVLHTHTTAGSAVACLDDGLSPDNFYAAQLHDAVAYHDFEGITVNEGEVPRMLAALGSRRALILRNHGLLVHGPSAPDALFTLWVLNRACEIQIAAQSTGGRLRPVTEEAAISASRTSAHFLEQGRSPSQLMFDALVRKVRKLDPSFES